MAALILALCLLFVTIIIHIMPDDLIPRRRDPYSLFHLSLNKPPSHDAPPKTEWLNMGYWKEAKTLPEACKALALKLISVSHLQENGTVLDVGYGTGESILLLLSEPSLPRPSLLVGITSLKLHHDRSCKRVLSMSGPFKKTTVDLHAANAVHDGSYALHPLRPYAPKKFDSILALDCAYHFNTRKLFLEQSFANLSDGGMIALADLCFTDSYRTKAFTKISGSIPAENMISKEIYIEQMQSIGYVDVNVEDISHDVFPGFVKFLKSCGWGWWIFGAVLNAYHRGGLSFVIVSGRKPHM